MRFEQPQFGQSPQEKGAAVDVEQKDPEQLISSQDTERINSIGELSVRLETAEESEQMFADAKSKQDAHESAEEWRKHRQDTLNFAVKKIEQIPNSSKILELVKSGDTEIIAKYDTQRQELLDKGVAASLMTPEEKQTYYDASSRKKRFFKFLTRSIWN